VTYDLTMANAEAGWYDDGSGYQRWWDGAQWTEHFADMSGSRVELQTSTVAARAHAAPGWYDDQRGRMRWWDGTQWTSQTRFAGEHRSFAGITASGEWIHFEGRSQPVFGAIGSVGSARDNSIDITIQGTEEFWVASAPVALTEQAHQFVTWVSALARQLPRE